MRNTHEESLTSGVTTSRRMFLKQAGVASAVIAFGSMAGSVLGAGRARADSAEPISEILGLALTAEQLATTFYYTGIQSASRLPQVGSAGNLPYLQAALDAENYHAQLLATAGGVSVAGSQPQFYFPAGTFTSDTNFLGVLDALETTFIEAYLAAIYQFTAQGRNDLAQVAGEILGVEAEHRVLGRQILTDFTALKVPNNLLLEKADGTSVAKIAGALGPFLSANQFGGSSVGPYGLPTQAQITSAVGGNAGTDPNAPGMPSGQLPETPFAGALPALLGIGGIGAYLWKRLGRSGARPETDES